MAKLINRFINEYGIYGFIFLRASLFPTLCWWWEGLVFRWSRPLGIKQVVVEKLDFLPDSSHLFSVFVEDVFSHKLWSLRKRAMVTTATIHSLLTLVHCRQVTLNFFPLRGHNHLSLLSSTELADRNFSTCTNTHAYETPAGWIRLDLSSQPRTMETADVLTRLVKTTTNKAVPPVQGPSCPAWQLLPHSESLKDSAEVPDAPHTSSDVHSLSKHSFTLTNSSIYRCGHVCVCARTLGWRDLGHRQWSSYVHQPAAMRHLVLCRILTEVVVIHRMNQTQVEQQPIKHLNTHTHTHGSVSE